MARTTKAERARERADAAERLRESLRITSPEGLGGRKGSLHISWVGGGATPYGRTDYYEIQVWELDDESRPQPTRWLNRLYCMATGTRFNPAREAVSVGGCGYSKSHHIASDLARIAGHPVRVNGDSCERWAKP